MTHGLYIGSEKRPVETGTREELRKLVRQMTSTQLRDGWRIQPIDPWPALEVQREQPEPNVLWVVLGAGLVLFAVFIAASCMRT